MMYDMTHVNLKYNFKPKAAIKNIIVSIQEWFDENGKDCSAVIGISGGKDSTIAAALCVMALGKERVIGVLMPNGEQKDIGDAKRVCKTLDIKYTIVNIRDPYLFSLGEIKNSLHRDGIEHKSNGSYLSTDTEINLAPRIRMATLYAIAQSLPNGGRVINTCNLSEDWVGYSTKYGDAAGDFGVLQDYTVTEILQIGDCIEMLPNDLVHKTPSDGLCGQSDEDKLGFSYEVLDKYIRENIIEDPVVKEKIDYLHKTNLFKLQIMKSAKSPLVDIYDIT